MHKLGIIMKEFIAIVILCSSLVPPIAAKNNQEIDALKAIATGILVALPAMPILAGLHDQTNPDAWSKTSLTVYFAITGFLEILGLSAMYGDLGTLANLLPQHSHTSVVVHERPWYHSWFVPHHTVTVTSY